MKKRKKFLFSGLLLLGAGLFVLSACNRPSPTVISSEEQSHQEIMFNQLVEVRNLDATIDVEINNGDNKFTINGTAYVTLESLDDIKADMTLSVDLDVDVFDVKATYLDGTAYLAVNDKKVKLDTDDINEITELFNNEVDKDNDEESLPTNLSNTGIAELIGNVGKMKWEDKGEYYLYTCETMDDNPPLIITSDLDHNVTSFSMTHLIIGDFVLDFKIDTTVLDIDEDRVSSPESEDNPYNNMNSYFGVFKQVKKIFDAEQFNLNYLLELRHYEPGDYDNKVYLGYTDGVAKLNIKDSVINLGGDIIINDPETESHTPEDNYKTTYNAQYYDKTIFLDYADMWHLSYTTDGLSDLMDVLDDKSVFPVHIFDILFGGSGKEYPIIDIITDGTYKELYKYFTGMTLTSTSVDIEIDNYLFGGEGKANIKVNFTKDDGITEMLITDLDINSYIVDGRVTLDDYTSFEKVNKDNYSPLDSFNILLRDGVTYYNVKKYAFDLDLSITNEDEETLTVLGSASVDPFSLFGGCDLSITDFSENTHRLKLQTYVDDSEKSYLAADYKFGNNPNVSGKASYDSIQDIYASIMKVISGEEEGEESSDAGALTFITNFLATASKQTIAKVLNGDYFAVLRDEMIKEITVNKGKWTIVIDKDVLALNDDLTIVANLNLNSKKLISVEIATQYSTYKLEAKFTLDKYDEDKVFIEDASSLSDYSSFSNLVKHIADSASNGQLAVVSQLGKIIEEKRIYLTYKGSLYEGEKELVNITDGIAKLELHDVYDEDGKVKEDASLLDQIDAVIKGTLNSKDDNNNAQSLNFVFGYQNDGNDSYLVSAKLGDLYKFYCNRENFDSIMKSVTDLLNSEALSAFFTATSESEDDEGFSLPIIEMLNAKDYQSLLSMFKGAEITGNKLDEVTITLSNALFNKDDDSTFTLTVKIDTDGLQSVKVDGMRYGEYQLKNAEFGLKEYTDADHEDIALDDYIDLTHIDAVISQVNSILENQKLGLDISGNYKDIELLGEIEFDLLSNKYNLDLSFTKDEKSYCLKLENDAQNCYIIFEDTRVSLTDQSIDEVITSIKNMLKDKETYLGEAASELVGDLFVKLFGGEVTPSEGDNPASTSSYISLLYKDYLNKLEFSKATKTLTFELNAKEFGLDHDATINVTFDENHEISNINASTLLNEKDEYGVITGTSEVSASISLKEYDPEVVVIDDAEKEGHWVNMSSVSTATKYFEELDGVTQKAIINQISDLMKFKTTGLTYNVNVARVKGNNIIEAFGKLNVDLSSMGEDSTLADYTVSLIGNIQDDSIYSSYDLRLVNGTAYFSYSHDIDSNFKISYDLTKLGELKALLYEYADTNPTLAQFINSIWPEDNENASPLSKALANGNYLSLLEYFEGLRRDGNKLYLSFNGEMIGSSGTIDIGLDTNNNGIHNIYVDNFYAFGYYLSGSFTFNANGYQEVTVPTGTYVPLDNINDIATDIIDLFGDEANKKVAYTLSGNVNGILIDASTKFILNKDNGSEPATNEGSISAVVTMGKKSHYVNADINAILYTNGATYKANQERLAELYAILPELRSEEDLAEIESLEAAQKAIVDEANSKSKIQFSYGDGNVTAFDEDGNPTAHGSEPSASNKMYGKLTLGTVFDIYGLFQELTSGENSRFANIMEMFSNDGPKSIFSQILSGDLKVFVDNKVFNTFSYVEEEGLNTYTIVLNGEIFKLHEDDEIGDITLQLTTATNEDTNKKYVKAVRVSGMYQGDTLDLTLTAVDYGDGPTPISLPSGKTWYEFNELKDLAEHIIDSAQLNDFILKGEMNLSIIGNTMGGNSNNRIDLDAQIHIENDPFGYELTTGIISFQNIKSLRQSWSSPLTPTISEDSWETGDRVFNIYIENIVVYEDLPAGQYAKDDEGNFILDKDGNKLNYVPKMEGDDVVRDTNVCLEVTYNGGTSYKRTTTSLGGFLGNIAYYIVNYGLGIKKECVGQNTNMYTNGDASTHTPTYSTLLQTYSYDDSLTKWTATLDIADLLDNSILGPATITITGKDYQSGEETIRLLNTIGASLRLKVLGIEAGTVALENLTLKYLDDDGNVNVVSQETIDMVHEYVQANKNKHGDYENVTGSEGIQYIAVDREGE